MKAHEFITEDVPKIICHGTGMAASLTPGQKNGSPQITRCPVCDKKVKVQYNLNTKMAKIPKHIQLYEFPKKINELNIDNRKGWGQTPNNAEIDYMGLKVKMTPSIFLKLAAYLPIDADAQKKIAAMVQHHKQGGTFGAPTLYIRVPDEWKNGDFGGALPRVTGHEGRHRMNAELEINGDSYVETHIFLRSDHSEWKNRYGKNSSFTKEIIHQLNTGGITSEDGKLVTQSPLFTL